MQQLWRSAQRSLQQVLAPNAASSGALFRSFDGVVLRPTATTESALRFMGQSQWASAAAGFATNRNQELSSRPAKKMESKKSSKTLAPGLYRVKPRTPGLRHAVFLDRSHLTKCRPIKSLVRGKRSTGGRNNLGHITVRHRGGGHKRLYRTIDFHRAQLDRPAEVQRLEYDPNRSADIALIRYDDDGSLAYILAPATLKPGDRVISTRSQEIPISPGNAMPLSIMPLGTTVHNIEMHPRRGGQLVRSAGTSAQLISRDTFKKLALVKLASKEVRYLHIDCMATVGECSNHLHKSRKLGKAGRSRWLGRRPSVRGVAMNPVDHPHGGGEGKAGSGRPSVTPWGKPTKSGYKTRRPNKPSNKRIVERRPKREVVAKSDKKEKPKRGTK